MKNLAWLLCALLVLAPRAFALPMHDNQPVARVNYYLQGNLNGATLFMDGRLVINAGEQSAVIRISEAALRNLEGLAAQLASAEIVHQKRSSVCYTLLPEPVQELLVSTYNTGMFRFEGEPRLVLTSLGCHMREVSYPWNANHLTAAQSLLTAITVLAQNTVQN